MKTMNVPEKAQAIANRVSGNADAAEMVRNFLEARRMMYSPKPESRPEVNVPERYYPEPDLGDWEYPVSTGMMSGYPIPAGYGAPVSAGVPSVVSSLDPVKDAARRIMAVENSKGNPDGGWNAREGRWYPHKSYEGGADTIAYGIKLSNGTPEAELALKQGYLTDEQATHFVDTLAQRYYDAARKVYDGKYGEGEWDRLSPESQSFLTDFSYNPGLAKFPKLMEGFHSGDMDMIRENYLRYSNGKPLGRNKTMEEELDRFGNDVSIFRRSGGPIHIKPENRGKFTAPKKRTGHSASWFKAHGTPAQKKMATFALNARHWKHDDGGMLHKYDGLSEDTQQMERLPWWQRMIMAGSVNESPSVMTAAGFRITPSGDVVQDQMEEPGVRQLRKNLVGIGAAGAAGSLLSAMPGAINWLSDPANQMLAGKFLTPLTGMGVANAAIDKYTPWSSWGDALYNMPMLSGGRSIRDYVDMYPQDREVAENPEWYSLPVSGLVKEGLEWTNPAFFAPYEDISRGLSSAYDRYAPVVTDAAKRFGRAYASDFMEHIGKPVRNNARWARDWWDFVVKGNTGPYERALSDLYTSSQTEGALRKGFRQAWRDAQGFPRYQLTVYPKTVESSSASAADMSVFPRTMSYTKPVNGSGDVPLLVEDIGLGGPANVRFLTAEPVPGETGLTHEFAPATRRATVLEHDDPWYPNGDLSPGWYESKVTGEVYPYTDQLLDSPVSDPKRTFEHVSRPETPSGGTHNPLGDFQISNGTGKTLPVQRGDAGQAAEFSRHVAEVEDYLSDTSATTAGSHWLYSKGFLSGAAHDYELVVPEEELPNVLNKLQIKSTSPVNDFTVHGNSPLLPQNEVDIQMIQSDANGNANGNMAWSLFKTMHPEEFNIQAQSHFDAQSRLANKGGNPADFTSFPVINPATGRPYTAKELAREFKSGNYQAQHVVNEALGLHKQYFNWKSGFPKSSSEAAQLLKQNRPMSILTNADPEAKQMVRTALDNIARSNYGPGYLHASEYFPNMNLSNVEANEKFLREVLHVKPEGIADDPELMKNLVDAWFLPRSTRFRVVGNASSAAEADRWITTGNVPPLRGSVAGSGANTTSSAYNGNPMFEHQVGSFQSLPSYREVMPDVENLEQMMKVMERTESGYTFTQEEAKTLNDMLVSRLRSMSQDMSIREGAPGRKFCAQEADRLEKSPIKTLDELDQLFNKEKGNLGQGLSDQSLSDIIFDVSQKLDIPDFWAKNGWNYDYMYMGLWNRGPKRAKSLRYIADEGKNPYETGRLYSTYAQDPAGSSARRTPASSSITDPDRIPDESGKKLYELFMDSDFYGNGVSEARLKDAGAVPADYGLAREELRGYLQQLQELQKENEKAFGMLQRYQEMPGSRSSRKKAEHNTGFMTYRVKGSEKRGTTRLFWETEAHYGGKTKAKVLDEILPSIPSEFKGSDIYSIDLIDRGHPDLGYKVRLLKDSDSGLIQEYEVTPEISSDGKVFWKWEDPDLPFAAGGFLNRMSSVYGNDLQKMKNAILTAKLKKK